MSEIKSMSEQEHTTEIEPEYLEAADLSPHAIVINHEINDEFRRETGDE